MLVLSRKLDESITIGNDIKITIIRVKGNTVRLGIEAPNDVRVIRSELKAKETAAEASRASNSAATDAGSPALQEASGTVTAVVDSPSPVSPRLFVGKVSGTCSTDGSRLTELAVELQEQETSEEVKVSDQAAPLRVFMRGSRSLTAV